MKGFSESDIIEINVGGTKQIQSSRAILCQVKDSALEKMFNGARPLKYTEDGVVFVDRDAYYFEMMVNYLRNYRRFWPQFRSPIEQRMFEQELQFWGIRDDTPNELRFWQQFKDQNLIEMFMEMPGERHGEQGERGGEPLHRLATKTWKDLGPIKIVDIVRNSQIKIDFMLPCIKREYLKGTVIVYGQDLQEMEAGAAYQLANGSKSKENRIL